jgi:hypothetical protein
MTNLSPNLKDIITLRCVNDKNANLTINGYKGWCSITLFADKKIIFKQSLNRRFMRTLSLGLKKALTINPGEKAGVLIVNTWKPEEKSGSWIPVCHIRLLKTDEGIIGIGIKPKDQDAEYQFLLQGTGAITADWLDTPAKASQLETETLIDLLNNFAVYDAIARLDRPAPGEIASSKKSSNVSDSVF